MVPYQFRVNPLDTRLYDEKKHGGENTMGPKTRMGPTTKPVTRLPRRFPHRLPPSPFEVSQYTLNIKTCICMDKFINHPIDYPIGPPFPHFRFRYAVSNVVLLFLRIYMYIYIYIYVFGFVLIRKKLP